jgi:hypothetical protein
VFFDILVDRRDQVVGDICAIVMEFLRDGCGVWQQNGLIARWSGLVALIG